MKRRKTKEIKRLVVGGVISQFYVVVDNLGLSLVFAYANPADIFRGGLLASQNTGALRFDSRKTEHASQRKAMVGGRLSFATPPGSPPKSNFSLVSPRDLSVCRPELERGRLV